MIRRGQENYYPIWVSDGCAKYYNQPSFDCELYQVDGRLLRNYAEIQLAYIIYDKYNHSKTINPFITSKRDVRREKRK